MTDVVGAGDVVGDDMGGPVGGAGMCEVPRHDGAGQDGQGRGWRAGGGQGYAPLP